MVQRQSWQQLSEAGDWTRTSVSGCKMRSRAPSSPLLWSPLHGTGSFPVDMPPLHPRNFFFFFLTQTLY